MTDKLVVDGGATIQTFSGLQVHLLHPAPEEITIEDIAHALAMQCRFTGHTRFHYSVAQHSFLASLIVPQEFAKEALLHDATEAYLCDLARPLKHFSPIGPPYLALEEKIDAVIRKKFGLPETMSPEVKKADNKLLFAEKEVLMPRSEWTHKWDGEPAVADPIVASMIQRWIPKHAEEEFLHRYQILNKEQK